VAGGDAGRSGGAVSPFSCFTVSSREVNPAVSAPRPTSCEGDGAVLSGESRGESSVEVDTAISFRLAASASSFPWPLLSI
jgi:hypothetical protein